MMKSEKAWLAVLCVVVVAATAAPAAAAQDERFAEQRRRLIATIEQDVRETVEYLGRSQLDARVLATLATVPRHEFVRPDDREVAYVNRPLPIGYGQTISQPYIVAVMTDLLEPEPGCTALEIGTGSGYQAAVLSELCARVYTIEIVAPLGTTARRRLDRLGYDNVQVRIGDGYYGWPEAAPFDVIVVTAVATHIPPPLIEQLRPGGRMVLPLGSPYTTQQLVLVHKHEDGRITTRQILPVAFVPLTGGHD